MNSDKKILGVSTLAVIALILIAVGATYAFFKATEAGDGDTPLEVTTNTTDSLVFNVDTDITMVADMSNFTEGKGNREGVSNATATLKANNKTNSATGNYYLYFDIKENGLNYTTEAKTAELLLQVTGPDGLLESGDIAGLNYVTVTDGKGESVSGFDITEVQNLITITSNKEITTTSEKVDNWEIKVILVNLGEDQTSNGGKKFNGELIIQKTSKFLGDICNNQNFATCLKENYELDSHLLHHTAELANSAEDDSYRYSGSYESVNNYICFGYDGTDACPWNNMYRIIGVFGDQIKLIKADYATMAELGTNGTYKTSINVGTNKGFNNVDEIGGYNWSNIGYSNYWAESELNTVNLNSEYLNKLNENWQGKIATTNWKLGGNTYEKIKDFPKNAYQNEIVSPTKEHTKVNEKIGLMYVSDYYYGASPKYWTYKGTDTKTTDYRAATSDNWIYMGLGEWSITSNSENSQNIYCIMYEGHIGNYQVIINGFTWGYAVRPCFYLIPEITLTGGTGTQNDPYRVS